MKLQGGVGGGGDSEPAWIMPGLPAAWLLPVPRGTRVGEGEEEGGDGELEDMLDGGDGDSMPRLPPAIAGGRKRIEKSELI